MIKHKYSLKYTLSEQCHNKILRPNLYVKQRLNEKLPYVHCKVVFLGVEQSKKIPKTRRHLADDLSPFASVRGLVNSKDQLQKVHL